MYIIWFYITLQHNIIWHNVTYCDILHCRIVSQHTIYYAINLSKYVIYHIPGTKCHMPYTVYHLPYIAHTMYHIPYAICHLQFISYQLPVTIYHNMPCHTIAWPTIPYHDTPVPSILYHIIQYRTIHSKQVNIDVCLVSSDLAWCECLSRTRSVQR